MQAYDAEAATLHQKSEFRLPQASRVAAAQHLCCGAAARQPKPSGTGIPLERAPAAIGDDNFQRGPRKGEAPQRNAARPSGCRTLLLVGGAHDRLDRPPRSSRQLGDLAVLGFDQPSRRRIAVQAFQLFPRDPTVGTARSIFVDDVEQNKSIVRRFSPVSGIRPSARHLPLLAARRHTSAAGRQRLRETHTQGPARFW